MDSTNQVWEMVLGMLSDHLTETAYNTWFADCTAIDLGENQLVLWDLNMMAHYLRAHRETMSPEQAAAITRELNGLARIQARAAQKKPYNRIESLDPQKALDRLAAELQQKVKTDEK